MCLDKMEECKGRDNYSICELLAYKKGLQKLGTDRQIRRLGRAFEHYFGPRGREFKQSDLQFKSYYRRTPYVRNFLFNIFFNFYYLLMLQLLISYCFFLVFIDLNSLKYFDLIMTLS